MADTEQMQLAKYTLAAAKLHEESYDKEAADKAERDAAESKNFAVDFNQFYRVSLFDAATQVCTDPAFRDPVYLSLHTGWNQALEWATKITQAN